MPITGRTLNFGENIGGDGRLVFVTKCQKNASECKSFTPCNTIVKIRYTCKKTRANIAKTLTDFF